MAKTHVAVVLRSLGQGGLEAHAASVSRCLLESGWRVTIIGLCDAEVSPAFTELGARIICLPDQVQQSFRSIFNASRLRKIIKEIEPDIVHLHGIRPIFLGGLATCLLKRTRVVCTMHGSYKLMALKSDGSTVKAKLIASHFMHIAGLILSDRYITVSNQLRSEMVGLGRAYLGYYISRKLSEKCISIYNGISAKYFTGKANNNEWSADPLVLGTVARMEPKKGISCLIAAFKQAKDRGLNIKLILVGDGYSTDTYKTLCRDIGVWNDVSFIGYQDEVIKALDKMDIFVLPSLSEGMPLVILEAMARCVPVIGTRVGGVPEIVKDMETGMLVSPGQVDELSLAIEQLSGSAELRDRLARNAYDYVSINHTEQAMFEKIIDVYDQVLRSRPV